MKRNRKIIIIIVCLLIIPVLLSKTNTGVEKVVNNKKVEIKSNADYVEFIDDELYIYLSVNFKFEKFKIDVLIDDEKTSNYPLLKMVQDIDSFTPGEYIKTIDLASHSQSVHIIVR